MLKSSEQINEISAALAKAQGLMSNPSKSAANPHFRSKYADLSEGLNSIRGALSENGIAVIQAPRIEGEMMMLDTRLSHSSAQWFECEWPICKLPAPPQQIGSGLTYARRYSLFAMVGIAGEDDDGNAANGAAVPAPVRMLTTEQIQQISDLIVSTETDLRKFLEYFGLESAFDLTLEEQQRNLTLLAPARFREAVAFLEQKQARMNKRAENSNGK